MRFVLLIIFLLFALNLHARENWAWVKFNDSDAGATAPTAEDSDLVLDPDEPTVVDFAVYFYKKSGCFPVIVLPSEHRVTGLQLRVDELEIYSPLTIQWKESVPIVWASFFDSSETSEEKILEYVQEARAFLRDISEGKTVRVKLEPSGEVRRWSLLGSKRALDAAMGHCLAGIEDQQYFPE